jgi:hypothetical protein
MKHGFPKIKNQKLTQATLNAGDFNSKQSKRVCEKQGCDAGEGSKDTVLDPDPLSLEAALRLI